MSDFNRDTSNIMSSFGMTARISRLEYTRSTEWEPPVDIYELEDRVLVVAELPGCPKDQVEVTLEGSRLKISARRARHLPEGTIRVHQMEIPTGRFARTVQLPPCSDVDRIEAKFDHGCLTIEIPKRVE